MSATDIPAWQYARLSRLSYLDSSDPDMDMLMPPGWELRNVIPSAYDVKVYIFVNKDAKVVAGVERGTDPDIFYPDIYPNDIKIFFGDVPGSAPTTESILRRLSDPTKDLGKEYIGYDIVSSGDSEGGYNAGYSVSQIRNDRNIEEGIRDRYYAVTFEAPHGPEITIDSHIVNIRLSGDPVSSAFLKPVLPTEVTISQTGGETLDDIYRASGSNFAKIVDPIGVARYGVFIGSAVVGLQNHKVEKVERILEEPEFSGSTPWDLLSQQVADPDTFGAMSRDVADRVILNIEMYRQGEVESRIAPVGLLAIENNDSVDNQGDAPKDVFKIVASGDNFVHLQNSYGEEVVATPTSFVRTFSDGRVELLQKDAEGVWHKGEYQVPHTAGGEEISTTTYTIQNGDTLSDIAYAAHTTVSKLIELNPQYSDNPDLICAGDRLVVPQINNGNGEEGGAGNATGATNAAAESGQVASGQDAVSGAEAVAGAQAGESLVSFAKALESGDTFSIVRSAVNVVAKLDLDGGGANGQPTALDRLNAVFQLISGGMNLTRALEDGDTTAAVASAASLGYGLQQVHLMPSGVPNISMPMVAGLNLISSLEHGDTAGSVASALYLVSTDTVAGALGIASAIPGLQIAAIAISVASMLGLFGGDEPWSPPYGQGQFLRDDNSSDYLFAKTIDIGGRTVVLSVTGGGGGDDDQTRQLLDGQLGDLADKVSTSADGGDLVEAVMVNALEKIIADMPPGAELIPERLPHVEVDGTAVRVIYPGDENNLLAQMSLEDASGHRSLLVPLAQSADAYQAIAQESHAVAAEWEADTVAEKKATFDDRYIALWDGEYYSPGAGSGQEYWQPDQEQLNALNVTDHTRQVTIADLDGDGAEVISRAVNFDIDDDGLPERSDWVGKDDALVTLDWDPQQDGITKGSDLWAGNLQWLDANYDGAVDAQDRPFEELKFWQDSNTNAQVDPGELKGLGAYRIVRLEENVIGQTVAVTEDGQRIVIEKKLLGFDENGQRRIQLKDGLLVLNMSGGGMYYSDKVYDTGMRFGGGNVGGSRGQVIADPADTRYEAQRPPPDPQREVRTITQAASTNMFSGSAAVLTALGLGVNAVAAAADSDVPVATNGGDNPPPQDGDGNGSGSGGGDDGIPNLAEAGAGDSDSAAQVNSEPQSDVALADPTDDSNETPQPDTDNGSQNNNSSPQDDADYAAVGDGNSVDDSGSGSADTEFPSSESGANTDSGSGQNSSGGGNASGFDSDSQQTLEADYAAGVNGDVGEPVDGDGAYGQVDNSDGEISQATSAANECGNSPPLAADDSLVGTEDVTLNIATSSLLANDSDANNDTLTITGVGDAQHGSVKLVGDIIQFVPDADYNGPATFTYTVSDGHGGTSTAAATVDLAAVNDPPVAMADTLQSEEDTSLVIQPVSLLGNDVDVDGDAISITNTDNPRNGAVSQQADGSIRFVPLPDFYGTAGFDYTVADGNGGVATASVTVEVAPVNDLPVVTNETVSTDEDMPLVLEQAQLLANDTDVDGDTLSISAVDNAAHGSASLQADGSIQFIPDADYFGEGGFDYTVDDGNGGQVIGTAIVDVDSVNDAPVAVGEFIDTSEDTINVILESVLLANDTDVDGDSLAISSVSNAQNGTVSLSGGTVEFTPDLNFFGLAGFNYEVSDGYGGTAQAAAVLDVAPVNDAPVLAPETIYGAREDDALFIFSASQLLPNDYDVEGDAFGVTGVSGAVHGDIAMDADGIVYYQPDANFNGDDTFTYTVSDTLGAASSQQSKIHVDPVNDNPYVGGDAITAFSGITRQVPESSLLANDGDSDGDSIHIVSVGNATHGSVSRSGGNVYFTPSAGYGGNASFTYTISDGHGGTATGPVSVYVQNSAPSMWLIEEHAISADQIVGHFGARDPNDPVSSLFFAVTRQPDYAHVEINSSTGAWLLTLDPLSGFNGGPPVTQKTVSWDARVYDPAGFSDGFTKYHVLTWYYALPVAVDLDGDGLEWASVNQSTVRYDFNGDGLREPTAWVGADDGLLVYDHDGDGEAGQNDEVSFVGYQDGATTDLEGLRTFDTDQDGMLSANDSDWQRFGIWRDVNQNGQTDEGEYVSLDDAKVESISLTSDQETQNPVPGVIVNGRTIVTFQDGTQTVAGDVALQYLDFDADNADEVTGPGCDPLVDKAAGTEAKDSPQTPVRGEQSGTAGDVTPVVTDTRQDDARASTQAEKPDAGGDGSGSNDGLVAGGVGSNSDAHSASQTANGSVRNLPAEAGDGAGDGAGAGATGENATETVARETASVEPAATCPDYGTEADMLRSDVAAFDSSPPVDGDVFAPDDPGMDVIAVDTGQDFHAQVAAAAG